MAVTHGEGLLAGAARERAREYHLLRAPRASALFELCAGRDVLHFHSVNEQPWVPLLGWLAGVPHVLHTLHNEFTSETTDFCDHTILVDPETRGLLTRPGTATHVASAISVPDAVPPLPDRGGRPLRILEMRRADKPVHFGLSDLMGSGAWSDLACQAVIVGPRPDRDDPRITWHGPTEDPQAFLHDADIVFVGHAQDTFGRAPREALAAGRPVAMTDHPVLVRDLGHLEAIVRLGTRAEPAAMRLREWIEGEGADREAVGRAVADAVAWLREYASIPRMIEATRGIYLGGVRSGPPSWRSFGPGDVEPLQIGSLLEILDAILEGRPDDALAGQSRLSGATRGVAAWMVARLCPCTEPQRMNLLREAHRSLGPRPLVLTDMALAHARSGNVHASIDRVEQAIDADPGHATPWLLRLELALGQAGHDAAVGVAREMVRRLPAARTIPAIAMLLGSALGLEDGLGAE